MTNDAKQMSIAKHIPDKIKKMALCVSYAAWLDSPEAWLGLPIVLEARLEPRQRAALAYAALKSLSFEDAELTADLAIYGIDRGEVST